MGVILGKKTIIGKKPKIFTFINPNSQDAINTFFLKNKNFKFFVNRVYKFICILKNTVYI